MATAPSRPHSCSRIAGRARQVRRRHDSFVNLAGAVGIEGHRDSAFKELMLEIWCSFWRRCVRSESKPPHNFLVTDFLSRSSRSGIRQGSPVRVGCRSRCVTPAVSDSHATPHPSATAALFIAGRAELAIVLQLDQRCEPAPSSRASVTLAAIRC